MNTYGDMVTLLLAFFVLLFAFSSLDVERFRVIMSSFQGALGILDSGSTISQQNLMMGADSPYGEIIRRNPWEMTETYQVLERLSQFQAEHELGEAFTLEASERGVIVHFTDRVLFDTGKAEIKPEGQQLLRVLAGELSQLPNFIRVEGHTDNVPIHNSRFPSNWELSAARATSVVRFLIDLDLIAPNRLAAVGYGEYRPIASNDDPAGRGKNRRVDIVILDTDLGQTEPSAVLGTS